MIINIYLPLFVQALLGTKINEETAERIKNDEINSKMIKNKVEYLENFFTTSIGTVTDKLKLESKQNLPDGNIKFEEYKILAVL